MSIRTAIALEMVVDQSVFSFGNGSTQNTITNNPIQSLKGGSGGTILFSHDTGGTGGNTLGIYLGLSIGNQFSGNHISNLTNARGSSGTYSGKAGGYFAFFLADTISYANIISLTNLIQGYPSSIMIIRQTSILLLSLSMGAIR